MFGATRCPVIRQMTGAWQCSPIPCIPGSEMAVNLTPVSTELGFEFKTVVWRQASESPCAV